MAVEEKSIGKLTLDITDVKKKIAEINDFLGRIGANINLEKVLTDKIGTAVNRLISEAKKAKDATENAFKDVGIGNVGKQAEQAERQIKSAITNATSTLTTFKVSGQGAINELVGKVTTGFDQANRKIREFSDSQGEIVKRTVEASSTLANYTEKYVQLYKAQAQLASLNEKGQIGSPAHIKAANEYQQALTAIQKLEEKAASNDEKVARSAARIIEKAKATNDVVLAMKEYEATMAGVQRREEEAAAKRSVEEKARAEKAAMEEEAVTLEALVQLYIKQENYERKAASATNKDNVELYKSKAAEVGALIEKVRQLYPELDKWAQADDRIAEAATRRKEAENNAEQKAASSASQKKLEDERQILTDLINLYVRRAQVETELNKASYSENSANVKLYTAKMDDILAQIDAIAKLYPELNQLAAANDRVAEAETRRANAANVLDQKASEANVKEQEQALSRYAQALTAYFNELASLNKAMSGKNGITTDSEEYKRFSDELARLKQNIKEAGETLDKDGRKAAASMDNVQHAIANAAKASAAFRDEQRQSAETKQIDDAEKAYKRLTTAVNMYNTAKRAKNEQQMGYWQSVVNEQVNALNGVLQEVDALHLDESVRDRILELIRQATTQQGALGTQTQATVSHTSDLSSAVNSIVTRYLSLLAVIRMIKSVLGDMIDYVHQYSDKMNEIRIITGKTSEEAERLGETYRNLAESMSVSSLDMADAAIYFTRQGLSAAEIEKRLKSTTMYAKTANIEFERAAELITAVVNSMNLVEDEAEDGRAAAQRVADVFLKVGDNAATSGEEIGEAMQKAAASAGTFGVQFEWLAAYIATVSETTRQEARTIGTAFNTIIARLHQIKQQGYNSEDETKINDIAKALANVDIALMDQSGEWRDMTDILQDVAAKWSDMDDKTRSYIATTMAGVKQQNVFLALMNDMSKGVEGGSRAFELYGLAVDSAGTSMKKYAVYEDSVTAAQNRLTVAQEQFYALLQSDVITWFYDVMTSIVKTITKATEATKGINLALPVLIGLVVALGAALGAASLKAGSLSVAIGNFAMSHPIVLGIAAMAAAFTVISGVASATSKSLENVANESELAAERYEKASQKFEQAREKIQNAQSLQQKTSEMFEDLGDKTSLTNNDIDKYNSLLDELAKVSPNAKKAVDELKESMRLQGDEAATLNTELENIIENQKMVAARALVDKYKNIDVDEELYPGNKANEDYNDITSALEEFEYYHGSIPKTTEELKEIVAQEIAYQNATDEQIAEFNAMISDMRQRGAPDEEIERAFQDFEKTYGWQSSRFATHAAEGYTSNAYKELWDLMNNFADNVSDEDLINLFAERWWELQFAELDTGEQVNKAEQIVQQAINEAVTSFANIGFDDVSLGVIRERLYGAIFGEDNELSIEEYTDYGNILSDNILEILANGVEVNAGDKFKYIAKDLFGNYLDMLFDQDVIDMLAQDSDYSNRVYEAYAELIKSGFSNSEIAMLFQDIGILNWADAVDAMREKIMTGLRNTYGDGFGLFDEIIFGENGEQEYEKTDWLAELDLETLSVIDDLQRMGVKGSELDELWIQSGYNLEAFIQLLQEYRDELDKEARTIEEVVKEVKDMKKEFDAIDGIIDNLKSGDGIKMSDILDLAEAHPELLAYLNDAQALEEELEKIKKQQGEKIVGDIREILLNSEAVMANSPFADMQTEETKTLADLGDRDDVKKYLDESIAMFLAQSGELSMVGDKWLQSFMTGMFSDANMDLLNRKVIDAKELIEAGWSDAGEGVATLYSTSYTAGGTDAEGNAAPLKWNQNVVVSMTPILDDGTPLTPENANEYMEKLFKENADVDSLWNADKKENGGLGLLIDITAVADDETFEHAQERVHGLMDLLHKIQEFLYRNANAGEESWLEKQVKAANESLELEWAKSNGYVEQMDAINRALESGGVEEAYNTWNHLTDSMKSALADTYPEIARAMLEVEKALDDENNTVEDLDKTWDHLSNTLKKSAKISTAKNFTSTYQAIQKLEKGTISATDAFDVFNKELDNITKAYDEVDAAQKKIAKGTSLTVNDVNDLAKALNMSAQEVIDDFPGAVAMLDELRQAGVDAFNDLNREATMKILGIGEADFSDLQKGMVAVQDEASATVQMLLALGQFKLEEREVEEGAEFPILNADGHGITTITATASGKYKYLVPTNTNPFGKGRTSGGGDSSSGKGGGGGGGDKNSNKNSMTEVERQLDRYSQRNAIQEYQQSYYGAQKSYYSQTGQLQGVIGYSQKEIDLLKEQSEVLEGNIKWIEEYIDKKSAELAQLSITDEQYEEVADDLDKLQKAHQEYTNQLIENKTSIDELTKAIEEQRKKIREMEINLRQTILKAIEDREKRTENMLNAEIEMENTILDLITKRYEKERDQIIENTNLKIDSLNKEKEALDEQLRIRKEQAEAEDKQLKLRELEAKYQRIIADPTRMKEAKSIKSEIDDLRKEMAWDLAEEEVKAQQDSIDQQITSLEDYIEYVQNYYEDLFEHPQKLIAEMRDIMMMTDQEIIEWLKANDEEFDKSTENTQNKMITSWQETLDTMHDVIKTYWDEVEYIIEQGEDYIINFLKENSEDYRQAGKLQAEAYVDEWMEQLENLRKAYQDVATEAASTYSVIEKADSSSSSKSGGGGGGGGGSGSGKNKHGYSFNYGGTDYAKDGYSSEILARTAGLALVESLAKKERDANGKANPSGGTVYEYQNNEINKRYLAAKNGLIAFGRGGIADFTGPAWLDGSVQDPERILTPYQNKLFETMVSVLEQVGRISISSMPYYGDMRTTGGNPVTVGDIIVNVENLDTDDDYEELAEKVSEVLMDRIGRTAAIGGLRIRSI